MALTIATEPLESSLPEVKWHCPQTVSFIGGWWDIMVLFNLESGLSKKSNASEHNIYFIKLETLTESNPIRLEIASYPILSGSHPLSAWNSNGISTVTIPWYIPRKTNMEPQDVPLQKEKNISQHSISWVLSDSIRFYPFICFICFILLLGGLPSGSVHVSSPVASVVFVFSFKVRWSKSCDMLGFQLQHHAPIAEWYRVDLIKKAHDPNGCFQK